VSNRPHPRLDGIARALAAHRARLVPTPLRAASAPGVTGARNRASVALVVRPALSDVELLLIKRATIAGDPWSGHMALPGGRWSPGDETSLSTAVRETREEVGLDLTGAGHLLGRLDDVEPRSGAPLVVVSPFVFAVADGALLRPNHEVALAIWVPLAELADPRSATEHLHALEGGAPLRFPAIGYQDHVIWGITHRILAQFLDIARSGGSREESQ
jgi:8-oxo-dGTP pyrophosphatase MutT (NUDIX family)